MKVLIFGLPGSGKSTLAKPVSEQLGAVWLNADAIREEYKDWDFTPEGRMRQAMRMRYLADGVVKAGKIAIADFVCPTEHTRKEFAPDYTVWMDTIREGRFEDTNKVFEAPSHCDCHVTAWLGDTSYNLVQLIKHRMEQLSGEENV
jgi:adenylylsulfate kinase